MPRIQSRYGRPASALNVISKYFAGDACGAVTFGALALTSCRRAPLAAEASAMSVQPTTTGENFVCRTTSSPGPTAPGSTVTVTGDDVTPSPRESIARAVIVFDPGADVCHLYEYGATSSLPIRTPPTKNSTRAIVPSESAAFAAMSIVAGAV